MKKTKPIYVVTTMRFGFKFANSKRSADGLFHSYEKRTSPNQKQFFTTLRERTWGWYASLETAKQSVEENLADIYEGEYDCALIEEIHEGVLYGAEISKEWWYKWKGSWEKGGYKPWKKPKEYDNVTGFMNRIQPRKA
jgi:hypothetical protein